MSSRAGVLAVVLSFRAAAGAVVALHDARSFKRTGSLPWALGVAEEGSGNRFLPKADR